MAVFAAAGLVAVEGVVAVYSASYIAWGVVGLVLAFWAAVAVAVGVILWAAFLPLSMVLGEPKRQAVLPGAFVALTFLVCALIAARRASADALGAAVLLNTIFLAAWAVALGTLTAVIVARQGSGEGGREGAAGAAGTAGTAGTYLVALPALAAVMAAAGLSYFVAPEAGAFTLVVGPLAAIAVCAAALERLSARRHRSIAAASMVALLALGFLVPAWALTRGVPGARPVRPIDRTALRGTGAGETGETGETGATGATNVILIVIDTGRADHMSVLGYKYPTTPNLARLAADSRLFPNGVAVDSSTLPSHAAIFTGKYPRENGARADISEHVTSIDKDRPFFYPLSRSQKTLASYLADYGYNTAGIAANFSRLNRQFGFDQGFYYYHDTPRMLLLVPGGSPVYKYGLEAVDRVMGANGKLTQPYWSGRAITAKASRWVHANGSEPFFLFLNYMDPHYPYSAVKPFDHIDGPGIPYNEILRQRVWEQFISDYINTGRGLTPELSREVQNQYDGGLAYADHYVGKFLDRLKAEGLYDDSLIIVTSDHGEFFGEHGLLDHSLCLYEEGVRVPIIVKYPRGAHAGEVVPMRVSIIDIFATVFDVLKLRQPQAPARPLGASDHPVIAENYENKLQVDRYGAKAARGLTTIYSGDWKYTRSTSGQNELYNLAADPREMTNLVSERPEVAARMDASIGAWMEATPAFDYSREKDVQMTPEMIEKLRSGGYFSRGRGPGD